VAIPTGIPLSSVGPGIDREPAVVEGRPCPPGGVVASLASCREHGRGRRMVRVRRSLILGRVARIAVRRRIRVVTVQVAICACDRCVRAGQREAGQGVVAKTSAEPGRGVVADSTLLRDTDLDVIRIRRIHEVANVARRARRAPTRDAAVHMAGGAAPSDVGAIQGKGSLAMIKAGT